MPKHNPILSQQPYSPLRPTSSPSFMPIFIVPLPTLSIHLEYLSTYASLETRHKRPLTTSYDPVHTPPPKKKKNLLSIIPSKWKPPLSSHPNPSQRQSELPRPNFFDATPLIFLHLRLLNKRCGQKTTPHFALTWPRRLALAWPLQTRLTHSTTQLGRPSGD